MYSFLTLVSNSNNKFSDLSSLSLSLIDNFFAGADAFGTFNPADADDGHWHPDQRGPLTRIRAPESGFILRAQAAAATRQSGGSPVHKIRFHQRAFRP